MLEFLEVVTNDDFSMVFYYILVLILLIGLFWTYLQIFVMPLSKKKKPLKENIIYQHSEDVIEESYRNYKKTKKNKKKRK